MTDAVSPRPTRTGARVDAAEPVAPNARVARWRTRLGPVGLWTSALDRQPARMARRAAADIEQLGFGALWVGEAGRREAFANASLLLAATSSLVVATGIANIWVRDAAAMAAGQRTLAEAWEGRFLLGLGVSHRQLVAPRGHRYQRPVAAMADYLRAMDDAPYDAPVPDPLGMARVVAALGPRMLGVAAEAADGAHPFLVPPEHTRQARQILGSGPLLCPEVAVVVHRDGAAARRIARRHLSAYLGLDSYRRNLARLGFDDAELTGGGSDRLVDAVVAWGSPDRIAQVVADHLAAGADHVAVQVLVEDPSLLPLAEWRQLAAVLGG